MKVIRVIDHFSYIKNQQFPCHVYSFLFCPTFIWIFHGKSKSWHWLIELGNNKRLTPLINLVVKLLNLGNTCAHLPNFKLNFSIFVNTRPSPRDFIWCFIWWIFPVTCMKVSKTMVMIKVDVFYGVPFCIIASNLYRFTCFGI